MTTDERAPTSALACPRCKGPLLLEAAVARCAQCPRTWPRVEGAIDFLAPPEHNGDDREHRP